MFSTLGIRAVRIIDPIESAGSEPPKRHARRFKSRAQTARYFQVSTRTVANWHAAGYIVGYKVNSGSIQHDLDEVEQALRTHPRSQMRDGRRLGTKGRIVTVTTPVLIQDGEGL
jgi:hypothetical protein